MDITALSKLTGLASSKIRYYEKMGLIKSSGRHGLKRTFKSDTIHRLAFINLSQSCGFSLTEIKEMLNKTQKMTVDRSMISSKIESIDEHIAELKKMKKTLNHISNCPERYHFDCPNFIKLLKDY